MDIEKINVGGTQYDVCDTVARAALSDEFSTGGTYAVGDYCIYENTLYKFTAAKEPGAWDASKVAATQISDELSQLNGNIGTLKELSGTNLYVYYNAIYFMIRVEATGISCSNNSQLTSIALPDGVRPTADSPIIIPYLDGSWHPTDKYAYLNFTPSSPNPNFRVSNDTSSVSDIVMRGTFVFPRSHFSAP